MSRGKQGRLYRACNILRSFDFVSASRRTLRSGWICFLGVQAKQTPRPSERRLDVSCQAVVEDCHGLVTSFNPSTPLQDQAHRLRAGWDDGLLGVAGKDNHAHLSARLHLGNDSGGPRENRGGQATMAKLQWIFNAQDRGQTSPRPNDRVKILCGSVERVWRGSRTAEED